MGIMRASKSFCPFAPCTSGPLVLPPQISPAAARKLLAAQASLVADTLTKQQHQQEVHGSIAQPAAAIILQYCLSDVVAAVAPSSTSSSTAPISTSSSQQAGSASASAMQESKGAMQLALLPALQQLNGLKLLPLADGQLQAIQAGLHTEHGPGNAGRRRSELSMDCAVYVTANELEQQLFQGLKYHMLHEGVGEELRQQLRDVAAVGGSNVHVLTAKRLDSHVLGLLLPPEWHSSRGHVEVSWQPQGDGMAATAAAAADATDGATTAAASVQGHPSREFIQLCWRWLADRSDAADVCHWQLLPVTGGKLRLLQQPAQVGMAHNHTTCKQEFSTRLTLPCTQLTGLISLGHIATTIQTCCRYKLLKLLLPTCCWCHACRCCVLVTGQSS